MACVRVSSSRWQHSDRLYSREKDTHLRGEPPVSSIRRAHCPRYPLSRMSARKRKRLHTKSQFHTVLYQKLHPQEFCGERRMCGGYRRLSSYECVVELCVVDLCPVQQSLHSTRYTTISAHKQKKNRKRSSVLCIYVCVRVCAYVCVRMCVK